MAAESLWTATPPHIYDCSINNSLHNDCMIMEISLHNTGGVSSYYSNPVKKKPSVMILRMEECHA